MASGIALCPLPWTPVPLGALDSRLRGNDGYTRAMPLSAAGLGVLRDARMHPFTLSFPDAAVERTFRADQAERSVIPTRAAMFVGLALWASFGIIDRNLAHGADLRWILAMRFGVVLPALLFGATATYFAWFLRYGQWVISGVASAVFWGASLTIVFTQIEADYPRSGLVLAVPVAFAFARMRFPVALATGLLAVLVFHASAWLGREMSAFDLLYNDAFVVASVLSGVMIAYSLERAVRLDFLLRQEIAAERARSEALLLNVLPAAIADRLKSGGGIVADGFAAVTVLFADIVSFTTQSARISPLELVEILDEVFTRFDALADRHGLEKIKTIGDAYMAAGGLPLPRADHAQAVAAMALEMQETLTDMHWPGGEPLRLRIGIATGSAVAGVIGRRKFAYDLWGDTVNTAARMESHGLPGRIQVSADTAAALDGGFELECRGEVEVKGKGLMTTYWLLGQR